MIKQAVIRNLRVIHRLGSDDHGVHYGARLQQRLPFAAAARQARGFTSHYRSNLPLADRGQKALKTGALHNTGGGVFKIVIDDPRLRPAERLRPFLLALLQTWQSR